MLTRRQILRGGLATGLVSAALGGYALAEPFRLRVSRYRLSPPNWPRGQTLRVAVLADLHACDPWMSVARIKQIVARTNALAPDVTLLLGDYVAAMSMVRNFGMARKLPSDKWSAPLRDLDAPLGVFGVLGNHDWWDDERVQEQGTGTPYVRGVLETAGVKILENDVVEISKNGQPMWIAGLGDQWAFWPRDRSWRGRREIPYRGVDDLDGMLAKVSSDDPIVVMAHEPDIFAKMPERVALTVSGHTHGGQVRVFGFAPIVPSRYGRRYTYGHIVEDNRNLIVSGGLGCSGLPVRFGSPPEIVLIELHA